MFSLIQYSRRNPIAFKLLGLIILVSSLFALFAILFQLYASFNDDVSALEKRLDQVRISSLPSITKSLWGFDEEQLSVQINSVLDVKDVVKVTVVWRDWNNVDQALVANRADLAKQKGIDYQPPENELIKEYPLVYSDQNTEPQKLGKLIVIASLDGVYSKLWERAGFIALLQGTKTLLVSLFILWLVRTMLTRHMNTIAQYARRLTLDTMSEPLTLKRKKTLTKAKDELDNITDAVNQMRDQLLSDFEKRHKMEKDLLAEKQSKMESQRQKDAAESANRAKSQFLATMSHEIRTPMNGVIGMVELLRDTPLNDAQRHYLDVIHRSGETLIEIINDILDYSKIEAGKMDLETVDFDLEELIEDCTQLFGATANRRHIELMGSVSPTTPVTLRGDPTRLRQVLINLLGNAFKFTNKGSIILTARQVQNTSIEEPLIKFSVHDSGIGISKDATGSLFESFSQADSSTTRKYGGTGLGLAICKRLAEMMGGEIGVESVENEGSVFWFTARFSLGLEPRVQLTLTDREVATAIAGSRILIVEDNQELCEVLGHHFTSWGMRVDISNTAQGALMQVHRNLRANKTYDFISLDYELPDMDGLTLARDIRDIESCEDIAMFMLTGSDTPISQEVLESRKIGNLLRKPISMQRIKFEMARLKGIDVSNSLKPEIVRQDLSTFSHLRVLVAEDNSVNRMVIKGLLGKMNIEPQLAENGQLAFEAVNNSKRDFDLILMDCEMPEMDGFEATRRIRMLERSNGSTATTIVALTAHATQEHRELVFECGMNYYLCKPITIDALKDAFEKLGLIDSAEKAMH